MQPVRRPNWRALGRDRPMRPRRVLGGWVLAVMVSVVLIATFLGDALTSQATLARLAALKGRYDPANLFHHNHNIPPTIRGPAGPEPGRATGTAPALQEGGT
jgi:Berberine and berberine like